MTLDALVAFAVENPVVTIALAVLAAAAYEYTDELWDDDRMQSLVELRAARIALTAVLGFLVGRFFGSSIVALLPVVGA